MNAKTTRNAVLATAVTALLVFSAPRAAGGQEPDPPGEARGFGRSWVVMPHLFSTPETGVAGGLVGVYYPVADEGAGQSVFLANVTYTAKSQVIGEVIPEIYLGGGGYWIRGELRAMEYPDVFYGVGNGARAEDEENFTTRTLDLLGMAQRRTGPNLWLGLTTRLRWDDVREREAGGLLAGEGIPGSGGGRAVGLGVLVTRDTRDRTLQPRRGSFVEASGRGYGSLLGSEFSFWKATVDLRRFLSLGPWGVLALRGYLEGVEGGAPFVLLPRIGGSRLLRGYREGRFRDDYLAAAQGELRVPLWWRFGLVAFGAMGEVADGPGSFPALDEWEACVGGGLRFFLNDAGGTFRLDWAGTREGSGLYISVGEAF